MEPNEERPREMANVWIRPLAMPSIGIFPWDKPKEHVDGLDLLRDITGDLSGDPYGGIKDRYVKLTTNELDLFLVPAEARILDKIVWPLKSAKTAYCLADYLACLALCGMVCEMAVVFLYDLIAMNADITRLPEKQQALFKDRRYERLGQQDRIKELRNMRVIGDTLAQDAHRVRALRREYLHLLTKDFGALEKDAYDAYACTFRIVKALVGLPLGDKGAMAVPAHPRTYLEQKGILSVEEREGSEPDQPGEVL